MLEECPLRQLMPGEVLFEPASQNRNLYLLLDGSVVLRLESTAEAPSTIVRTGGSVGEVSALDGEPCSSSVIAVEPTRVVEVSSERFWSLVVLSHAFAVNSLTVMAERLRGSMANLRESIRLRRIYQESATSDALTGLHNRRWLDEMVPRFIRRHVFEKSALCVVLADIDHFKHVNDHFGHPAGDFVLREVAKLLQDCLRPGDRIARWGGEEFVVLLPNTSTEGAWFAAERVRARLAATTFELPDQRSLPTITMSLGVAALHLDDTYARLLERADAALLRAKRLGRNRTELADSAPE